MYGCCFNCLTKLAKLSIFHKDEVCSDILHFSVLLLAAVFHEILERSNVTINHTVLCF